MTDELSWIGLGIGILGIFFSYIIYRKVSNVEETRREEQKQHFKTLVTENVNDAFLIYDSVSILAHRESLTEEEHDEKTIELQQLLNKKQSEIQTLVRDTKFYASMLSVVDTPSVDMKEIIEKISWLTDEFYILDHTMDRNKRHWPKLTKQLLNNKQFIMDSLDSLRTP